MSHIIYCLFEMREKNLSHPSTLALGLLNLFEQDFILWANVLELLAYASGAKAVVRLVVDDANQNALTDFCDQQHWPWRQSGFWLEPAFQTTLNDTFTYLNYGASPAHSTRVLYIGDIRLTQRAEELELLSDSSSVSELASLYGYPLCCALAYADLQTGIPWLDAFFNGSDPSDFLRDWRINKPAYLFAPNITLIPEYFPCSIDCQETLKLARLYELILTESGLHVLLNIVQNQLSQSLLLFEGMLYRFSALSKHQGWYDVTGRYERYNLRRRNADQADALGSICSIRIDENFLTLMTTTGKYCKPLIAGQTQWLSFGEPGLDVY